MDTRRPRAHFRAYHTSDQLGTFRTREEALLVRDFVLRCRLGHIATYNFPVKNDWVEMP